MGVGGTLASQKPHVPFSWTLLNEIWLLWLGRYDGREKMIYFRKTTWCTWPLLIVRPFSLVYSGCRSRKLIFDGLYRLGYVIRNPPLPKRLETSINFFLLFFPLSSRSNLESSLLDHPELALLFYLCQMMLRELGKCSRLVQLIPMDMTGYFGERYFICVGHSCDMYKRTTRTTFFWGCVRDKYYLSSQIFRCEKSIKTL